ncbi:MAG: ABC transporter ATP-binding protein [Bacilli bacterium]|jgi:peptide/nickel transport system ATP-binding protein|nr:ABC transporter ATP-binding protein [Bacilli bacterium]
MEKEQYQGPIISLDKVNVSFLKRGFTLGQEKHYHVLKDISLDIYPGEILAIVGESGCGKTTLGKVITGLLKPDSGKILFQGEEVYKFFSTGSGEYRKAVQFIQQDSYAALNPVRTIYQLLYAPIRANDKSLTLEQIEKEMIANLVTVGLTPAEQFLFKYPHQLSGGQRQRILMARAISLKPKVIVADEPVSMIDVSLRLSILNLMSRLNKELNIAFIYITHDLATARYIARNGKIAVMYLGEIMEYSSLQELLTNPKHPYTRALLSAVPVPDPEIARKMKKIPIKTMDLMNLEHRKDGCSFAPRCLFATEECLKGNIPYREENQAEVRCLKKIKEENQG